MAASTGLSAAARDAASEGGEFPATSPQAVASAALIDELVGAFQSTVPFPLDDFQVEAIAKLETHRAVLVSAPTSSGKTLIAEYLVWRTLAAPPALRRPETEPRRVVYTTPLKALSNQKWHDLRDRYGDANVGLITGEHTINDAAPVVIMTTEILRNVIYDEPSRLDDVGDVVLDEVHYIDDYPRGTVWEEVIVQAPAHIRFLGLSATVSNVDELAEWMATQRGPVATVVRTERPVELRLWLAIDNQLHPLFDSRGNADRRTLELALNDTVHDSRLRWARRAPDNDLIHIIEELRARDMLPAIYFIFSRRGCREALARCAIHGLDLTTEEEKCRIDALVEARLAVLGEDEREVVTAALDLERLRRGVAMHHAGMLPYAKETVERLFTTGLVKVVFATETLSLGLNMPARSCVVSSFTKFDGTGFHPLTSAELTQLMGRAGRRGIDTLGHGIILKEADVDVRDIYDAAMGGEMSVISKFSPTYTMTLNLLERYSVPEAEALLERSFGQFQNLRRAAHWEHKQRNLVERLRDLRARPFRHPRVPCTERTIAQHLRMAADSAALQAQLRRLRRDHWRAARRGTPVGRSVREESYDALRHRLRELAVQLRHSPCGDCPLFTEHRANHLQIREIETTLRAGRAELRSAQHRYRTEFEAYRTVLTLAGFLEDDRPTRLGRLAASLFGESALLVAEGIEAGWFAGMEPAELAASLVMLVAEDRGRERPPGRRRFPTPRVEAAFREMRRALHRLDALERQVGLATLRPLSHDYVEAAYRWVAGVPLAEIEPPPGGDLGDVVKAVKNLYSMLRQMEQALRGHPLEEVVRRTREACERDLVRRV